MKPANHLYNFILILILSMALGSCECQPELKIEGDNKVEAKKKSAQDTDDEDDTPEDIPLDEHAISDEPKETDAAKEGSEPKEQADADSAEQKENGEEKEPGKESGCESNDNGGGAQPTDGKTDPKAKNQPRTKTVVAGEIMNLLANLTNKSTVEGKKFLEKLDQQLKATKSGTSGFPFGSLEDLKTQNKPEELKSSLQYIQGLLQSTLKNAQSEWEKDLKGTVKIKNCNDINVVLGGIYQKIKELEVGNLPEN